MSIIQDKKEAIKLFLGGITEENEHQQSCLSLNNSALNNSNTNLHTASLPDHKQPINQATPVSAPVSDSISNLESLNVQTTSNKSLNINTPTCTRNNNELIDANALKMASNEETDNNSKLDHVNTFADENRDEHLENNNHHNENEDIDSLNGDVNVNNEDDDGGDHVHNEPKVAEKQQFDDDDKKMPAKFSLDSKFNDEIVPDGVNDLVPNVIYSVFCIDSRKKYNELECMH